VWASIALHLLALVAVSVIVSREHAVRSFPQPGVDTRATDEPRLRMQLAETAHAVELTSPPAQEPVAPSSPATVAPSEPPPANPHSQIAAQTPAAAQETTVRTPHTALAPRTLPPEMLALVRRQNVVNTGTTSQPLRDPNVRPAAGTGTAVAASRVPAIHGALKPQQTVVYVLDSSGSMGANGKLAAASESLLATLQQQPESVRFQVIVYDGTATPLLASNGQALPTTAPNIRDASAKLVALEARGRSNHLVALRAALAYRPDVIVLLTDATEVNAATLKPLFAGTKPIPVCVCVVTETGVQPPRELK
jgi:hypothetical protein